MAETLVLGQKPLPLRVVLVPDSDFVSELVSDNGDWPTGTWLEIRFDTDPARWAAAITGASAAWSIPRAEVNRVRATEPEHGSLWIVSVDSEQMWRAGRVELWSQ